MLCRDKVARGGCQIGCSGWGLFIDAGCDILACRSEAGAARQLLSDASV